MRAYSGFRLRSRFGRKSSRAGIEESTTPTNGNGAADRTYTWQEVAAHNTAKSVWVTVRGKVYDITGMLCIDVWVYVCPGSCFNLKKNAGNPTIYTQRVAQSIDPFPN